MKKQSYIYALICPIDGIRYIGKTDYQIEKRLNDHKTLYRYKRTRINIRKTHKENWFNKLYEQNKFDDIKIIEIEKCDATLVFDREKYWIAYYNGVLPKKLTNMTKGGEGSALDEEQIKQFRDKIREFRKKTSLSRPIIALNLTTKKRLYFDFGSLCREYFDIKWHGTLNDMIKTKKSHMNYIFAYTDVELDDIIINKVKINPYGFKTYEIPTNCWDLKTNTIIKFSNIKKCADYIGRTIQATILYINNKQIYDDKIIYTGKKPNKKEYAPINTNLGDIKFRGLIMKVTDLLTNETTILESVIGVKRLIGIHYLTISRICNTPKLYKNRYRIEKVPKD